ncbi:hypothetical protein FSP39_012134 [Pinctada imbricata]|uniref:Uncharacterized protein n=1 Tax=Pinctada imbricata TaxID=66713 RepID=A0AA88XW67_PINIB|nr:hypothetical protein FSP39_012134 [Pinctada imbricata]
MHIVSIVFVFGLGSALGAPGFEAVNAPLHASASRYRRSLDQSAKNDALAAHNAARNNVSPPASNMQTAVWNDDLANTAQNYANECVWAHNSNRKSQTSNRVWSPDSVGENLYRSSASMSDSQHLTRAIEMWVNEKYDYDLNSNTCSGSACGHYTQVVWHNSVNVGCGINYCSGLGTIVVCNYGPAGNYIGQKPYTASSTGGSSGGSSGSGGSDSSSGSDNDELSCGFESSDLCGFSQTVTSFQWKRRSGSTPSSSTGPSGANEGQYYMYTEVSGSWSTGSNAILESASTFSSGTKCVQFDYNMNGNAIGTLDVMAGDTVLWSLSGNQGSEWQTQEVETSALANEKLSFKGTYGGSWKGDIAIDNLSVTSGGCSSSSASSQCSSAPCQNGGVCTDSGSSYQCSCTSSFTGNNCEEAVQEPSGDCDFESGLCGMSQGTSDDKNWKRTNTAVSSGYFTTGYYIYISGSTGSPGDSAYIETGSFADSTSDRCVQFKFNMQGSNNGILSIGAMCSSGNKIPVTTVSHNTNGFWYTYYLTLSSSWLNSRKLYFEATTGSDSDEYIALDNIEVIQGSCPTSKKRELEIKGIGEHEIRKTIRDKGGFRDEEIEPEQSEERRLLTLLRKRLMAEEY